MPASCVTVAADDMVVETDSSAVFEARWTILESMLAKYLVDCMNLGKVR